MKQNSNTDILIERLKQNQYESELERRKDADALFAAGCAEDNDTWKSLALYYLASERIRERSLSFFSTIFSTLQDIITGLVWMRGTDCYCQTRPYDCVLEQSCPGPYRLQQGMDVRPPVQ